MIEFDVKLSVRLPCQRLKVNRNWLFSAHPQLTGSYASLCPHIDVIDIEDPAFAARKIREVPRRPLWGRHGPRPGRSAHEASVCATRRSFLRDLP